MSKRPGMSRRVTPAAAAQMLGQNPRKREKEYPKLDTEFHDGNELDRGESFPQYCMACERQFIPYDYTYLYCSEACRQNDECSSPSESASRLSAVFSDLNIFGPSPSSPSSPYTSSSAAAATAPAEPRDIIPRARPSRPSSMHFPIHASATASPYSHSSSHPLPSRLDETIQDQHDHYQYQPSSAVSALASLNGGSFGPGEINSSSSPAGLWEYVRNIAGASPGVGGIRGWLSSTCGQAPRGKDQVGSGLGYHRTGGSGCTEGGSTNTLHRPLPPLRNSGRSRPKSIELVTSML